MPARIFKSAFICLLTVTVIAVNASRAPAHPPWGIVVSSTGIVYFTDLETVWKIDRDGRVSVFRGKLGGRHVHELAIDRQDNLYGPDSSYDPRTDKYVIGVWKMTPDGKETSLQRPIDSVMSGISIWRDAAGNMYSVEQNNHIRKQTLLLRRTPAGAISTLAGGAYGHQDGKGAAARFESVNAMTIAPDGNIYLTDGDSARRVTLDGTVTTLAKSLAARTSEDKPTLFGGVNTIIMGLAVDYSGNSYVADAGNRRLLRIAKDGSLSVVYRCDPPYYPTGVFATRGGGLYVLEFRFTPPSTTDNPRVRRISPDGENRIITSGGAGSVVPPSPPVVRARWANAIEFVNNWRVYFVFGIVAGLVTVLAFVWRRRQRTQSA